MKKRPLHRLGWRTRDGDGQVGLAGSGLDDLRQFRELYGRQPARIARAAAVLQTGRALRVEAMDPVAERLAVHAADLRRLRPAHPVQGRRDRQQATALVRVLRARRKTAKLRRRAAPTISTTFGMARLLHAP